MSNVLLVIYPGTCGLFIFCITCCIVRSVSVTATQGFLYRRVTAGAGVCKERSTNYWSLRLQRPGALSWKTISYTSHPGTVTSKLLPRLKSRETQLCDFSNSPLPLIGRTAAAVSDNRSLAEHRLWHMGAMMWNNCSVKWIRHILITLHLL